MRFFDRFGWRDGRLTYNSGNGVTKSALQEKMDSGLTKSARTPVYDSEASQGLVGAEKMHPPYDQHYLEYMADNYSHLRTVVQRIASQTVAKGWSVNPIVENPDESQKERVEELLHNPTAGDSDISGTEMIKALVRQFEVFDDAWVSIVYDYFEDDNGVQGKRIKQLWVEDAKYMRFNTDEFGRFQKTNKFSPISRKQLNGDVDPKTNIDLVPIAYSFDRDGEDSIPFGRDEIIHFNKYSASARLYGQSPILGLSKKLETALAIEKYQNKLYRLERPPKGFLDIQGHDEQALNRLGEYIAEETARNPNFIPIISSGEGKAGARFVPVMPSNSELEMLPYIEKINQDVNSAYGVMPLAVGDMSGVGGLNSEGEQITMMDRTILETQKVIEDGFFKPLLDLMKITDYEVVFDELNEKNEAQHLMNLSTKADIIAKFQAVGIVIDMDEDGQLILPEDAGADISFRQSNPSRESLEELGLKEPADLLTE